MWRFCYGAYLKILTLCSPKSTTQKYLCGSMFLAINPNYDILDDDATVAHLKDCSANVSPEITDYLSSVDVDNVVQCFERDIIPRLSQDKLRLVVAAMLYIIMNDANVEETSVIGRIGNKTKADYRTATTFSLPEFLTDFLIFSLGGIDNRTGSPSIKEINSDFLKARKTFSETITLVQGKTAKGSVLTSTFVDKDYNNTFEEVSRAKLGLSNEEDFRIFRVKLEDYKFEYSSLRKFLTRNLGRYVYSRARIQKYKVSGDEEIIGIEAAQLLRDVGSNYDLGSMMLYAFLEKELNAPKILSKIELGQNADICSGIYLKTIGETVISHQLVYGASNIQGYLRVAIDNAFKDVLNIKANKPNSISLVESAAFKCAFPDEATTKEIEKMILPSKSEEDYADTAFGIFLGYSLKMPEDTYSLSMPEFKEALRLQLEQDIVSQASYISHQIRSYHLGMHSFYIYVLPFNDANADSKDIMLRLVGGAK